MYRPLLTFLIPVHLLTYVYIYIYLLYIYIKYKLNTSYNLQNSTKHNKKNKRKRERYSLQNEIFKTFPVEYIIHERILIHINFLTSLRAHNTFTVILDSYSLQKNCSTFYDECSSLKNLNITVVVRSLGRKTVILLRVIVSKQPVIGEKSLLTFLSTAQPMNCDRSGNLNPLNETGVGALLKLFLCDTKPGKLVGVVNC